jgi:hypothetical protein
VTPTTAASASSIWRRTGVISNLRTERRDAPASSAAVCREAGASLP